MNTWRWMAGVLTLRLVRVHHGLGHTLALVIAGPRADGVHVAPVRLGLGVHRGVAVHLSNRKKWNPGMFVNL